ncbi:MAG: sodium:solute symporter [Deltaproteobacteria bacterium]|nr:MAG: sodium:solute symporter [Deltaproteobacteria bacterium]
MNGVSGTALQPADLVVIGGILLLVVVVGFMFGRRASGSLDDFFLGGRRLPWWLLGISGTASNFDMAGTMVMVSFVYAIGMQGFWVAMRGGMCLPLGILLVYMGRWLRRSRVMTTAEWMELRFGSGTEGQAARLLSAVSNLVVAVAFLSYFVKGTGKFLGVFLPLDADTCSILMVGIGLAYTAASGLFGVVFTDLIQELLMLAVCVLVAVPAFCLPEHSDLLASAGESWVSLVPRARAVPMPWLKDSHLYEMFGLCIVFWIARGLLEGAGGLTGGYMPQRYYAARNEREAVLLSAEWVVLLLFRWALVVGVALLGMAMAHGDLGVAGILGPDPEKTLPYVIGHWFPSGVRGLAVAGLMAASLSTFDSTLNAAASYWVRDIYQRYIRPSCPERDAVFQGRLATVVLAALGLVMGLAAHNIDDIWSWITGPLSAGLFAPVVLRWYWWRFNGTGFAASTAAGLAVALLFRFAGLELPPYIGFPAAWIVSFAVGIVVSLRTSPTPDDVLVRFWKQIRPFGWWSAVRNQVPPDSRDSESGRAALGWTAVAVAWLVSGVVAVVSLMLHRWLQLAAACLVFAACAAGLFGVWLPGLKQGSEDC